MTPKYFKAVNKLAVDADLASPLADNLEELELFAQDAPAGSFRAFLILSRVMTVIKLKIAFELLEGKSFLMGYEQAKFAPPEYIDETPPDDEYVVIPNILYRSPIEFSAFINILLGNSISTIDTEPFFEDPKYWWTTDGRLKVPFRENVVDDDDAFIEIQDDEFYFTTDGTCILEGNKVYATKELVVQIKQLITDLAPQLNDFLEKFAGPDTIGVSHEYYVQWFQKLFPGKIKYRTLEHKK